MPTPRRLIVVTGREGVGKSTIVRALLPETPRGAVIDGEDVGQVNPWVNDEAFRDLHRRNVAALARNFWAAGYPTVVAGSFLDTYPEYVQFQVLLPEDADVTVVHLFARRDVRDRRRATRAKQTTQEWRDMVDQAEAEAEAAVEATGATLRRADGGYRYVALDTSDLSTVETVARVKASAPSVYGAP